MRAGSITLTIVMGLFALGSCCIGTQAASAASGPGVARQSALDVVIRDEAAGLERFAATELDRYLRRLFGAAVRIIPAPTKGAECVFLLGTRDRLPGLAPGEPALPSLTDQGFVLRRSTCSGKPAMLVIGGSPTALLWGVYELVERYGVVYLLSGDVFPEKQAAFCLPEIDERFEPCAPISLVQVHGRLRHGHGRLGDGRLPAVPRSTCEVEV